LNGKINGQKCQGKRIKKFTTRQLSAIVTIDAMRTQTSIVEKIIEKEADYILNVKDNQKTLREEVSST
jgi:predicted transposase YbfD/YdcC